VISQLKFDLKQEWREDDESLQTQVSQKCDGIRFDLERLTSSFDEHKSKQFAELLHRVSALEKTVRTLINTVNKFKGDDNKHADSSNDKQALRQLEARV